MSYEIVKSIDIKNDKVYIRQCSNNVTPKSFYKLVHHGLTKTLQKKGKKEVIKQILKWAFDGYYQFEPSNQLARVLKQAVDETKELHDYDELIYEKYRDDSEDEDYVEMDDDEKGKMIDEEIAELAWWQYYEIIQRPKPKPAVQTETVVHVEKISIQNGNGACSNCDRGTLKKSGGLGLEYPYDYTYHITVGHQVIRLCEDCKENILKTLTEM